MPAVAFVLAALVLFSMAGNSNGFETAYYVNPQGNDENSGLSTDAPFQTIQKALDLAGPGDTIRLSAGVYGQDVLTKANGQPRKPITITGPKEAVVMGDGSLRIIEIKHSFINLEGFTVNGQAGEGSKPADFRDKLIYVIGGKNIKITGMTLKNAGGECIRLRYFAQKNEISGNTIQNCGRYDFRFNEGGKNGEGIYIGTAPEQLDDGRNPTADTDQSNNNLIQGNTINTQGNECVDIKEGSSRNIIENNSCTGQQDPESAGLDSRGNENIFRKNNIFGNKGAGIRLGGDEKNDGTQNDAYENTITDNEAGGIKFEKIPQGKICGNTFSGNKEESVGSYGEKFQPSEACAT